MVKNKEKLCDRELLEKILRTLEGNQKSSVLLNENNSRSVYDNKALKELLGIKDKYLKKLRDNGYIGYSRHGDKYWYTHEDLERFLRKFHYEAFATNDTLPTMEGGGYA